MIDANSFWVPSMSRSWSKSCMHANLCYSHNNLLPHPRPSPPQVATLSCPKPWNHDGLLCHPHPVNQAILLALPSQNIQNAATPHYLCCRSQSYIIFNAVYDNSLPSRYPWSLCSPFYSQHDGIKVHPFQPSAQALAGLPHISVNTKSLQWLISPPSPLSSLPSSPATLPCSQLSLYCASNMPCTSGHRAILPAAPSLWKSFPDVIPFAGISPHGGLHGITQQFLYFLPRITCSLYHNIYHLLEY